MPRPYTPEGEASVFGITANIVSNVVGGGCLLLPSAFHDASLIPGIIGLIGMGILAIMSIFYMILCCEKTQRYTYKDLLALGVHPKAGYFFEIILFSYTYLILVGWAKIIVDSMPPVAEQFFSLSSDSTFTSAWFWLVCAACIFFPLSSLKALAHLTWSSVIGFMTILYVAIIMIIRLADGFYTKNWDSRDTFPCSTWNITEYQQIANSSADMLVPPQTTTIHDNIKFFDMTFLFVSSFPQFSVAYSCHYNIPPFFGELRRRTPLRMLRACTAAYAIICSFYILVGTTGILTFGPGITGSKGDVLKCYSFEDTAMNIGRLLMFFHFCCVFPIVSIAVRRSFNALVFPGRELSHPVLIIEAFFIVLSCCVIAYVVPGIGFVFTLDGALFGLSIVLIIPGLFYYRIFDENFDLREAEAKLEAREREDEKARLLAAAKKDGTTPASGLELHTENNFGHTEHDVGVNYGSGTVIEPTSPKYVTSDAHLREEQGYGVESVTDLENSDNNNNNGTSLRTESIPTEWDLYVQGFVEKPSKGLRYMSIFSMFFGAAMSILSLVNAIQNIVTGKNSG